MVDPPAPGPAAGSTARGNERRRVHISPDTRGPAAFMGYAQMAAPPREFHPQAYTCPRSPSPSAVAPFTAPFTAPASMINRRMTGRKPPTHRAYCVLRPGRRAAGQWLESGFASVADDGNGLRVYLQMLPVTGFDGHILLRPLDAKPEPLPPDPDDEDDELQQS